MPIPVTPITPAIQAVNNANKVISILQLLSEASQMANEVVTSNSVTPMQTAWNTLNTAVLNPDGTVSKTQDVSPNSSNPINANVYSSLLGAFTSTQLGQFLSLVVSFQSFASGASVQNGLAPALLLTSSSGF